MEKNQIQRTVKKVDDYTLEVTKQAPAPEPVVVTYDRTFIENQLISIKKQKDDFYVARDAELADCQAILDEMDAQGVVARPTPEPTPAEPAPSDSLPADSTPL